jgi:signal transduction histidine kinase
MTDQVQMKERIVKHKDILEREVKNRTWKLKRTTQFLREEVENRTIAEKKARDEYARAELFLDLLSHDVGNIYQVLFGWIQILNQKLRDDQTTKEEREVIESTLRRGIKLVHDIKLINKMEGEEPDIVGINVIPILGNAFDRAKKDLGLVNATLNIDNGCHPGPLVLADEKIEILFYNLIHKGLKVQLEDNPVMEISLCNLEGNGLVKIIISDHGPGISDKNKEILFMRRMRSGEKQLRGIGLMMVNLLVNRYGGKIEVKDRINEKPEKGASFHIQIPSSKLEY